MTTAFGLIIVGDEILSGKRSDKHLPKVIELLTQRGLALSWMRLVGDDREHITAALRDAFAGNDVVFSCGGIGATPDDHTRQCAAAALGVELALHPEAQQLIESRMRDQAAEQGQVFAPERPDNVHRYNMGVFPVGARIIPNPYNKIPGFSCTSPAGAQVHFLPGFPVMAWPMIEGVLDTQYAHLQRRGAWAERSVIVFGAMEAVLTPLMEQIERTHPVKVFSLPSVDHPEYGRHIELGVKGAADGVLAAYGVLLAGLRVHGASLGPEMVRD
ncbi:competence/damage-inducible protein A [Hydrogenophaga palleronii]|uniref:competence/damage-inducible protein A n=1 Tax=Hydrogenophaga palleronii TaxID=65655 RepID=UPI000826DF1C|nr:molybdopterin-binding protein [Hydrogenophaga palleronii]